MSSNKTSNTNAVRDMYDSMAGSYSEMMDSEIAHPIYSDTLDRLRSRLDGMPGLLIDAPCGSGHMLSMYHTQYDADRPLLGIDLSPEMVAITKKRLGSAAEVIVGDIRRIDVVESGSAAAVISHFAFHHLDSDGIREALTEWRRALMTGGQLVIAAWEGDGAIDYGGESDLIAIKHSADAIESMLQDIGFTVSKSWIETDDEMQMDAVYIEATKE
jgi:ubiquinone/menaquinone biosynthesis C-methylase UbiE